MADGGEDSLSERDVDKDNINLAGFLFGNINEKGQLEDNEILDEVSKLFSVRSCKDKAEHRPMYYMYKLYCNSKRHNTKLVIIAQGTTSIPTSVTQNGQWPFLF